MKYGGAGRHAVALSPRIVAVHLKLGVSKSASMLSPLFSPNSLSFAYMNGYLRRNSIAVQLPLQLWSSSPLVSPHWCYSLPFAGLSHIIGTKQSPVASALVNWPATAISASQISSPTLYCSSYHYTLYGTFTPESLRRSD